MVEREKIKTLKIKIIGLNGRMDMGQTSKSNFEINNWTKIDEIKYNIEYKEYKENHKSKGV